MANVESLTNASWNSYNAPPRTLDTARTTESGSGGEGRPSKRLQKESSNNVIPSRPAEPTPLAGIRPDPFPTPATRRRQSSFRDHTFREQRASHAPSALPASPSKRLVYNGLSTPQAPPRTFASNVQKEPHSRQSSINNTSRFSFASTATTSKRDTSQSSGSFDFLPPINFDDLQTSVTSDEPGISSFPAPGGSAKDVAANANGSALIPPRPGIPGSAKTADASAFGSRIGLNGSSLRRHNSTTQRTGQKLADSDSMAPPIGPASARARRKTYFPSTNTGEAATRSPRKSVGPGVLMNLEGTTHPHRRPSLAQAGLGEAGTAVDTPDSAASRNVSEMRNFQPNRPNKTKSMQPPPSKIVGQDQFFTPNGTPDQAPSTPISAARSPARPTFQLSNTPSSSNKRVSMMPGSAHATGLGARTISPTDARRLKRMSMMPNPPPMPYTPPTPQADPPPDPSPLVIPRKSETPSSSRTTPDPNPSSGSHRISQSLSTSRLPTPKTRGDNSSAGDEEFVPPVPAIPKAYESPKTEYDQTPFFATRKSSQGHDASSLNSSTSTPGSVPPQPVHERHKDDREMHQIQATNVEREPATERKPNDTKNANKRTLQPLRLPPLNLLPLSTSTASKIAALHDATAATKDKGTVTPPPKVGAKAIPTTPMTASKASFSRGYYEDDNTQMPAQIRSSSSHYNMRPEALSYRDVSSSSTTVPTPSDSFALSASRTAMSPFVSSSLPKLSGEYGYGLEKSNTFDVGADARPTRLTGPRLQKPRKASKDDASSMDTTSSVDAGATSFGSSLRRKLSLTRKRSCSKAQTAAERDAEFPPKPPKHDDMPPPKLPASATWNGPLLPSPSPSQKSIQSRATRNPSNSSVKMQHDRTRDIAETPKKDPIPSEMPAANSKRTARAALEGAPIPNSLSLKDFLREAKTMETQLDRDDLSAEEEMRRLASKRKETEKAAKEVDGLRRRATAKERVSPNSALRMAHLNIFERGEIVDYKDVYFCGTQDAQKHVGDLKPDVANFGYDDDRGDYNIVNGDHLAYRYEIVDILGKGSFGQVVRCVDHKTGVLVAIKIIRNKKRFHQQALVEVDILQKLREWDPQSKHSMVNFVQSFYFRGHLCISTELLGMNLYEFIKAHEFRGFSLKLIRRFAKQLLSSLVLLKGHKVIHCDLKPENVLLAHPAHSEIKVIDFGSSCLENEKVYTYIQSRFYRSPEVILGMTYGMPIDMWSLGCILAELLTGYPIFPGENEQEQLACIMEVFGPPEKHLIEKSTRKKIFFDSLGKPRLTVSTKGKRRRPSSKSLQTALKCEDEAFLDFITRCLRWDPDRRLKPDEAIQHEFITGKNTKSTTRPRTAPSQQTSSPIKRYNSITHTPASTRPLPDPPATSFKNGTAVRNRDITNTSINNSHSPIKPAATVAVPKRLSTMTGPQTNGNGTGKRTMNGAAVQGSALPRVTSTPRNMGTTKGMDLGTAAAAASLATKQSRVS